MKQPNYFKRLSLAILLALAAQMMIALPAAHAQQSNQQWQDYPLFYGPYYGTFLADGDGLKKPLLERDILLRADSPWTIYCWANNSEAIQAQTLVAGVGKPREEYPRFLGVDNGRVVLWIGKQNSLSAPATLTPGKWHMLAATFDGKIFRLYNDGAEVASGPLVLGTVSAGVEIAPTDLPAPGWKHFGGKIASLTVLRNPLSGSEIKQIYDKSENFALPEFEVASKPWPVQTRGQAGYRAPQDPFTIPRGKAAFSAPVAQSLPAEQKTLVSTGENEWIIGNWMLAVAPKVSAEGSEISKPSFKANDWMAATVPGTVLTTMVDRGVYPDPDYGLNNLAIPETLNKQNYWYRTEFTAPKTGAGRNLTLTFQGINYNADVWLNGQFLGNIKGAFIRGVFDVTATLKPGSTNVLAVKISPPPHPGIPQEQSIKGGPGENGGLMCLDGPTFVASEGWDWIPAIRDRDTGIWQPVTLSASGSVQVGDTHVVTTLPLPDTSKADVDIEVPLQNNSNAPVRGTLKINFEQVAITKAITIAPGSSSVKLSPREFAQLTVQNPRLWWPNGYGKPELYHMKVAFTEEGGASSTKELRFGIREITYEVSLLDSNGHLARVEYAPTKAIAKGEPVVDVTHDGMRQIPPTEPPPADWPASWRENWHSWVSSLYPGAESSASILKLADAGGAPYLVIKVNGVKIACRGGNWGMDDSRKRVSREKLEPYFRLHRDANLNIIRNWVGQNTEEVFYDLADEYGLLIWNDFWESTEDYNIEAQDPELFLKNAKDTILHFRNHPSIAMWCGRNEGVPQPIISNGLDELTRTLDGTRYYSPSSNRVNLQDSGPYRYQDPKAYYTSLNRGFSVETGTPSMSTLEAFKASIPKEDQWPINDVWAYHDFHMSGNGDMAPFLAEIQAEFGAATSLEDFERKAQMLNYVDHRAIFEGMNAHLWTPNSGRLLWMTQPAWPSNTWQILSSDYDTQASFYGVQKACEPVHIQLDLSSYKVAIVNTTTAALSNLSLSADVLSLDNKVLAHAQAQKSVASDSVTDGFQLDLAQFLGTQVVLVKLDLEDATGKTLSTNLYWLGAESESYRQLNTLPAVALAASATATRSGDTVHIHLQLKNNGGAAALQGKLTLLNGVDGSRILPAYFSDNYISLLPQETREVEIEYPHKNGQGAPQLALRGWNITPQTILVRQPK